MEVLRNLFQILLNEVNQGKCKGLLNGSGYCTCSEQPPAVLLVCGALAVVAEALRLVEAALAIHLKAVFRTVPRHTGAVFSKVAAVSRLPANTISGFEL